MGSFLGPMLGACALAVALTGCAPKLEKPQLSVVSVALEHGSLFEQHLKVRMHVHNPNRYALHVRSLDYSLAVGTEQLARGAATQGFTVPALGETEFDMRVTADMAAALLKVIGSHGDALEYHLIGKVTLAEGFAVTIPFDEHGSFKLR